MSYLVEPVPGQQISPRSLAYISQATRDSMYDFIIQRFLESGVSKSELAKRLGKDPAQLTRTLGAPGNWTIDTCAELLFGIDGSVLTFGSHRPLRQQPTNQTGAVIIDMDAPAPQAVATTTSAPAVLAYHDRGISFAAGANR